MTRVDTALPTSGWTLRLPHSTTNPDQDRSVVSQSGNNFPGSASRNGKIIMTLKTPVLEEPLGFLGATRDKTGREHSRQMAPCPPAHHGG